MRKRTPKNEIIRVGDLVKIKDPQMFVRCGYPLSFEDVRQQVDEKYQQQINDFLRSLKIPSVLIPGSTILPWESSAEYDKIRDAIAYYEMRRQHFGGNRRSIHTEENIWYKDQVLKVVGIHFVKTGFYSPSFGGNYYEEYEPAYLEKQEAHKILTLCRENECINVTLAGLPKIEARFVEKIIEEKKPSSKVFPDSYGTNWWD